MDSTSDAFETWTKEQWLQQIRQDLKGKSLESLEWEIEPGIRIDPFPHRDDLEPKRPLLDGPPGYSWEIAERFHVMDPAETNTKILEALENGMETLVLAFSQDSAPAFDILLRDVRLDFIHTIICPRGADKETIPGAFMDYVHASYPDRKQVRLSLLTEPLPTAIPTGSTFDRIVFSMPQSEDQELFVDMCVDFFSRLIELLSDAGTTAIGGLKKIGFSYGAGSLFFPEIARLHAIRLLWRNITAAIHGVQLPGYIHTGFRDDLYGSVEEYNMIKAATVGLSAILGKADAVEVLPSQVGQAPGRERRIARNLHHILRHESHLGSYASASKGSYYLETLTRQYTETCWERLREKLAG